MKHIITIIMAVIITISASGCVIIDAHRYPRHRRVIVTRPSPPVVVVRPAPRPVPVPVPRPAPRPVPRTVPMPAPRPAPRPAPPAPRGPNPGGPGRNGRR